MLHKQQKTTYNNIHFNRNTHEKDSIIEEVGSLDTSNVHNTSRKNTIQNSIIENYNKHNTSSIVNIKNNSLEQSHILVTMGNYIDNHHHHASSLLQHEYTPTPSSRSNNTQMIKMIKKEESLILKEVSHIKNMFNYFITSPSI